MDDDGDVVGIVERRGGAIEGGVIEGPFRRRDLPDQLAEVAPVLGIPGRAALGGEVVLVPPLPLRDRRQRRLVGGRAADRIAADRDQRIG
jgi:hypothetical protein